MSYQKLRTDLLNEIRKEVLLQQERLSWNENQIKAFQKKGFDEIIKYAKRHSLWHANRLNFINTPCLDAIIDLPLMTKQDAMEHWDEIITDKRLTKKHAEEHLKSLRSGEIQNPYYLNKYLFFATGGSSGKRGLFVWDWDFFVKGASATFRYQFRDEEKKPVGPQKMCVLTAPSHLHASTPLFSVNIDPQMEVYHLSADTPLENLSKQIEDIAPTHLIGFSSVIHRLSLLSIEKKLNIKPYRVSTNSEPLGERERKSIRDAWGLEVNNMWGSVEFCVTAVEDDDHVGMYLAEDLNIFETVDENFNHTENPDEVKKIVITSLYNKTFPMIRYVIDDVVEIARTPNSGYRYIKSIGGRSDDWFMYHKKLCIHPMVFRHVLGQNSNIKEYQVEQTKEGAIIRIVGDNVSKSILEKEIIEGLKKLGLNDPQVEIEEKKELERNLETGKVKRFIALKD